MRRGTRAVELGRISDRLSFLYAEACDVDRDHNAVTFTDVAGTTHVPGAQLAALLLGPGSRMTQAAAQLLADSGVVLCWTGQHAVRLYAAGVAGTQSTVLLLRQAELVCDKRARLGVVRAMYGMRFPGEDVSGLDLNQLRGREGARVREVYQREAARTGVVWKGRSYRPGSWQESDRVNKALSSANAALYGVVHAAIVYVGCSPGLGFLHTGHALSFVYDVADLYKARVSIPAAFDAAADLSVPVERAARTAVRDRIVEERLMESVVADVLVLLGVSSGGAPEEVSGRDADLGLWDPEGASVAAGRNYEERA